MPLTIIRNDITKVKADAIVNAANNSLLGGGGVDGAIHAAAGPELLEECRKLGGCETGMAKITKGYRLPAKYVIHTVGPVWHGGDRGERELLASCYRESLKLAKAHGCESIAFPLISAGAYGYPEREAMDVASEAISEFLAEDDIDAALVIYGSSSALIGKELFDEVQEYIDDNYDRPISEYETELVMAEWERVSRRVREAAIAENKAREAALIKYFEELSRGGAAETGTGSRKDPSGKEPPLEALSISSFASGEMPPHSAKKKKPKAVKGPRSLSDKLFDLISGTSSAHLEIYDDRKSRAALNKAVGAAGEDFRSMLLRKVEELGLKPRQYYSRANVDAKLFSKIKAGAYKPSKSVVLGLIIGLALPLKEAEKMLMKAGYAFSDADKSDIIVKFFISNGVYDVYKINQALFDFDQKLLGNNIADTVWGLENS